jgi:hypothetical protein
VFNAAPDGVAISIANDLALASSRQVEVTREHITRVVTTVAVGPARIITWRISLFVHSPGTRITK